MAKGKCRTIGGGDCPIDPNGQFMEQWFVYIDNFEQVLSD